MADKHLNGRWFQFRLRTLLIAILLLSLPLSWFAVRLETARRQREAVERIDRLGGSVDYDWTNSIPSSLARMLGDDFFYHIDGVWLSTTAATDADLEHLQYLGSFYRLNLMGTLITDAGLERLKGLTELESLNLAWTQVTDAGLVHLQRMTGLTELDLAVTEVTDAGLGHLKGLTNLEELYLGKTNVTSEGVKKLQEALPNCKIDY